MTRVLFVDDEKQLLDGLQDLLRRMRREWEMVFALGASEALHAIADGPFDVVVSDMKMPGVDGAELLERVRELNPGAVRIVLSGQTSHEEALRAVPVAQQFLPKPTDAETITRTIRRACELRALLDDELARSIVGETTALPTAPEAFLAINDALVQPETSLKKVAEIVACDVALSAKLLQLVNSAFFGLGRRITAIDDAVAYLGIDLVRAIVLASELGTVYATPPETSAVVTALDRHAVLVAGLAARLRPGQADVVAAALLHDVGSLVLLARRPEDALAAIDDARRLGRPLEQIERERIGSSHAEVGAYLLGVWGLPDTIVEAAALHHRPQAVRLDDVPAVAAVHAADVLAWSIAPEPTLARSSGPELDPAVRAWFGTDVLDRCLDEQHGASPWERTMS